MPKPTYHKPATISTDDRARWNRTPWELTTAMLDLWSCPTSKRYMRFAEIAIRRACRRVAACLSRHDDGRLVTGPWMDVLGLTTEFDYFLSYPCE